VQLTLLVSPREPGRCTFTLQHLIRPSPRVDPLLPALQLSGVKLMLCMQPLAGPATRAALYLLCHRILSRLSTPKKRAPLRRLHLRPWHLHRYLNI
jgi:hypothetical protein